MPRTCTICSHSDRSAIEERMLSGESFRNIAERFATSPTALFRHKSQHLARAMVKAHEAGEVLRAESLVEHVQQLRGRTEALFREAEAILAEAKRAKDLKTALAAIRELSGITREARGNAALLGQLTGEFRQAGNQEPQAIDLAVILNLPR